MGVCMSETSGGLLRTELRRAGGLVGQLSWSHLARRGLLCTLSLCVTHCFQVSLLMTPCSRFFFIDSHCTLVAWSSSCHPSRLCFLSLQMPFQPWAQVPVEVLHAHRDVFTAGEALAPSSSAAAWSSRTSPTTSVSCTPKLLYLTPPSRPWPWLWATLGYFRFVFPSLTPEHPNQGSPWRCLSLPTSPCLFAHFHLTHVGFPADHMQSSSWWAMEPCEPDPHTPPPRTCHFHIHLHLYLSVVSVFLLIAPPAFRPADCCSSPFFLPSTPAVLTSQCSLHPSLSAPAIPLFCPTWDPQYCLKDTWLQCLLKSLSIKPTTSPALLDSCF